MVQTVMVGPWVLMPTEGMCCGLAIEDIAVPYVRHRPMPSAKAWAHLVLRKPKPESFSIAKFREIVSQRCQRGDHSLIRQSATAGKLLGGSHERAFSYACAQPSGRTGCHTRLESNDQLFTDTATQKQYAGVPASGNCSLRAAACRRVVGVPRALHEKWHFSLCDSRTRGAHEPDGQMLVIPTSCHCVRRAAVLTRSVAPRVHPGAETIG